MLKLYNINKGLTFIVLFVIQSAALVAQQNFKSGYRFSKKFINREGTLFLRETNSVRCIDTIGYFISSTGRNYLQKVSTKDSFTYRCKVLGSKNLKGIVSSRNEDTLFIKFWPINSTKDDLRGQSRYINSLDKGDYFYVIKDSAWKKTFLRNRYFTVPYRADQLMATNIPFRILTKKGTVEPDFLNANISYQFLYGRTRLFKSSFVEPRNRFLGWGVFAGASTIKNEITLKDEFGLNYGINFIESLHGLNLIFAYGRQRGFNTGTNIDYPFIGFGIGFKLMEVFNPEIKKKGD